MRADAIAARVVGGLASATLAASSFLLGGVACGCGDPWPGWAFQETPAPRAPSRCRWAPFTAEGGVFWRAPV